MKLTHSYFFSILRFKLFSTHTINSVLSNADIFFHSFFIQFNSRQIKKKTQTSRAIRRFSIFMLYNSIYTFWGWHCLNNKIYLHHSHGRTCGANIQFDFLSIQNNFSYVWFNRFSDWLLEKYHYVIFFGFFVYICFSKKLYLF